jgi:exodeoxyribonuclease-3
VTLRLLSYNIRFGGLGREEPIAETIKGIAPDLVVFQEATHPAVIERVAAAAVIRSGPRAGTIQSVF